MSHSRGDFLRVLRSRSLPPLRFKTFAEVSIKVSYCAASNSHFCGTVDIHAHIARLPARRTHRLPLSRLHRLLHRPLLHRGRARNAVGSHRLADLRNHQAPARPRPGRPRAIPPRDRLLPACRPHRRPRRSPPPLDGVLRRIWPLLRPAIALRPARHHFSQPHLRGRSLAGHGAMFQFPHRPRSASPTRPRGALLQRRSLELQHLPGRNHPGPNRRRACCTHSFADPPPSMPPQSSSPWERSSQPCESRPARNRALANPSVWPPSSPASATSGNRK